MSKKKTIVAIIVGAVIGTITALIRNRINKNQNLIEE